MGRYNWLIYGEQFSDAMVDDLKWGRIRRRAYLFVATATASVCALVYIALK